MEGTSLSLREAARQHGFNNRWLIKNSKRTRSNLQRVLDIRVLGRDDLHFCSNETRALFPKPREIDDIVAQLVGDHGVPNIARLGLPRKKQRSLEEEDDGSDDSSDGDANSSSDRGSDAAAVTDGIVIYVGSPASVSKAVDYEGWIHGHTWHSENQSDQQRQNYECSFGRIMRSQEYKTKMGRNRPRDCLCRRLSINVTVRDQTCTILVLKGRHIHSAVTCGEHGHLDPSIRKQIEERLMQGARPSVVLDEIISMISVLAGRNNPLAEEMNKRLVPDKKAAWNIWYRHVYHKQRFSRDDLDDLVQWIEDPSASYRRGVVLSKYRYDEGQKRVVDHLNVILHNDASFCILQKCGPNGRFLLDSTHGTNQFLWPLYSLGVVVDMKQRKTVVVARMITSDNSSKAPEALLRWARSHISCAPRDILIDNDIREKLAIRALWGEEVNIIICYFHLLQFLVRWLKHEKLREERRHVIVSAIERMCGAESAPAALLIHRRTRMVIVDWESHAAIGCDERRAYTKLLRRWDIYGQRKHSFEAPVGFQDEKFANDHVCAEDFVPGDDQAFMYVEMWCHAFWRDASVRTTNGLEIEHKNLKYGDAYLNGLKNRRLGDFVRKIERGDFLKMQDFIMLVTGRHRDKNSMPVSIHNDFERGREVAEKISLGERQGALTITSDGNELCCTLKLPNAQSSTDAETGTVAVIHALKNCQTTNGTVTEIRHVACSCPRMRGTSFCKHVVAAAQLEDLIPSIERFATTLFQFTVQDEIVTKFREWKYERACDMEKRLHLSQRLSLLNPSFEGLAVIGGSAAVDASSARRPLPVDHAVVDLTDDDHVETVVSATTLTTSEEHNDDTAGSMAVLSANTAVQSLLQSASQALRQPGRSQRALQIISQCQAMLNDLMGSPERCMTRMDQLTNAYGAKRPSADTSQTALALAHAKSQNKPGRQVVLERRSEREAAYDVAVASVSSRPENDLFQGASQPDLPQNTPSYATFCRNENAYTDVTGKIVSFSLVRGMVWRDNSCAVDTLVEVLIRPMMLMSLEQVSRWTTMPAFMRRPSSMLLLNHVMDRRTLPLRGVGPHSHFETGYIQLLDRIKCEIYNMVAGGNFKRGAFLSYPSLQTYFMTRDPLCEFVVRGLHPAVTLTLFRSPKLSQHCQRNWKAPCRIESSLGYRLPTKDFLFNVNIAESRSHGTSKVCRWTVRFS
eukprot:ANDGO_07421.mRNA.1 hypothetical protein